MRQPKQRGFFDAVLKRQFGPSTCFLCGCRLGRRNRADEHVVPKWVQKRYKLTDQQLHLLNGTTMPYRQLTIPCCFACNNNHLQPLERRISRAVFAGPSAVRALDHHDLFLWLGKIFYGLLYRQLFLPWDRSGKTRGKITNKAILKRYEMHHLFLQSARMPVRFVDFSPASILVVHTQEPNDARLAWDFRDELNTMCIACRMGSVGLIAVLQDGGAQQPIFPLLRLRRRHLHPLQFREVMAQVMYRAMLLNRTPKYLIADGSPSTVIQMPLGGFSTKPLYNDWDHNHYAQVLSQITRVPLTDLFRPPDQVMTWLLHPDGKAKSLPLKRYPSEW